MLALSATLALLASNFIFAQVIPSKPGPGESFNEGSDCVVTWLGDPEGGDTWKPMSIQLMTGADLNQLHITTLSQELDGSVDGSFSWPCPQVEPNSAIYFYQFSSAKAGRNGKTWTTRFTIAGPGGATVPPANDTQPGSGAKIPWGIGALVDPSTATPEPAYLVIGASSSAPRSSTRTATPVPTGAGTGTATKKLTTVKSGATATPSRNSTASDAGNAAVSIDAPWRIGAALVAGALAVSFAL